MSESEFPPIPVTSDELLVRWADRDVEYAKLRRPLNAAAVASIREARKREASQVKDVEGRARAWHRAATWTPPRHQDYGSMRDFLE